MNHMSRKGDFTENAGSSFKSWDFTNVERHADQARAYSTKLLVKKQPATQLNTLMGQDSINVAKSPYSCGS